MEDFAVPLLILGLIGLSIWSRHLKDQMVHRERLAAIEKGVEPPPWPDRTRWPGLGVNWLLLSGLIWLAVGIGGMIAGYVVLSDPSIPPLPEGPPPHVWVAGLVPVLIGLAHLIVYRLRDKR